MKTRKKTRVVRWIGNQVEAAARQSRSYTSLQKINENLTAKLAEEREQKLKLEREIRELIPYKKRVYLESRLKHAGEKIGQYTLVRLLPLLEKLTPEEIAHLQLNEHLTHEHTTLMNSYEQRVEYEGRYAERLVQFLFELTKVLPLTLGKGEPPVAIYSPHINYLTSKFIKEFGRDMKRRDNITYTREELELKIKQCMEEARERAQEPGSHNVFIEHIKKKDLGILTFTIPGLPPANRPISSYLYLTKHETSHNYIQKLKSVMSSVGDIFKPIPKTI